MRCCWWVVVLCNGGHVHSCYFAPPWYVSTYHRSPAGWHLPAADVTPTSMRFEALFGWCVLFGGDVTPTSMIWGFIWLACPVWWWCYTHLHDLRLYLVGGDVTPTSMIWGFIWLVMLHPPPWDLKLYLVGVSCLVVMLHPPPWFEALFGWRVLFGGDVTPTSMIWGFIW